MKQFFILITLSVLGAISVNQSYAQSDITVETSTTTLQDNAKAQKPTRYDRIWAKYRFVTEPLHGLTEVQKELKYKLGDILTNKTTIKNGRVAITIKRKDLRKAKLPAELYYVIMKNIEAENKFLASSFDAQSLKEVESNFERAKDTYWVESNAYWQNRNSK